MRPKDLRAALLIAAVTLLPYLPTLRNGFVWDDDVMVVKNPLVHASDGLVRMWITTQQPDYWPVSLSTFWFEWHLWGLNSAGYHATNLALHLATCLLLWSVLRRLEIPGTLLATLLFAAHPVNVESVAWIAQRKNLMAMLFYLLSVGAFVRWLDAEGPPPRPRGRWYGLSLVAFLLAMLSKGSVAMLPLVLLGIIAWRRRPARRDAAALAPFFLVAAVLVGVNLWFAAHGLKEVVRHATLVQRILGTGPVIWFYLGKAALPANLSFVYPIWHIDPARLGWYLPLAAALGLTLILATQRRLRPVLFAWLYFGVMLAPVLGLTDVYFMRYSPVADHYQHLALIGVVALAGAAWSGWRAPERLKLCLAAGTVAAFMALAWRETLKYRDTEAIFRATLRANPDCFLAYDWLGVAEERAGHHERAEADLRRAVELEPRLVEAYLNLGAIALNAGRIPEAEADFRRAVRLDPDRAAGYLKLGSIELVTGRSAEAEADLKRALQLDPSQAQAYLNLGAIALSQGRAADALPLLRKALQLKPDYPQAYYYLGNAQQSLGHLPEAAAAFTAALQLQPNDSDVENYLGTVYAAMGRTNEAILHYRRALRLNPGNAEAQADLAAALRSQ